MRLLLTGATGYAGTGLAEVLSEKHWVRGLDVRAGEAQVAELVVGDLADLEVCRKALEGIDAMVLCHMAPNPAAYQVPPTAFDPNVKGAANLYHAAVEKKIHLAVLVSSTSVLTIGHKYSVYPGDGPYNYNNGLYALTKVMQEGIARFYYESAGVRSALLRPAWVVYDGKLVTKYGVAVEKYTTHLIDPRDIGRAALKCLELPDLTLEAFNLGQDDADFDVSLAHRRLNWRPEHRFESLPR